MNRVAGLVFHAPLGDTSGERLVENGRWAATLGLARRLRAAGMAEVYVVTPNAERCLGGADAVTFLPSEVGQEFHFGNTLRGLITQLDLDGVLYFGSGSGGLLSEAELGRLIEFAGGEPPRGLFNNFYSCDFCSLSGAREVTRLELPGIDNPLGFALADAGIPCFSLARTATTQFDIDTPTDLLLLARSHLGSPELREYCASIEIGHPTLDRALAVLTDRSSVTSVVGRLSPVTWSHFETQAACRIRHSLTVSRDHATRHGSIRGRSSGRRRRNPRRASDSRATYSTSPASPTRRGVRSLMLRSTHASPSSSAGTPWSAGDCTSPQKPAGKGETYLVDSTRNPSCEQRSDHEYRTFFPACARY
ncbi:MAG: hypothetical protein NTV92_09335 [Candidatus Bipolaricaulota bacterium]|nr:hypothetical protein [Candidatus Bipolaricaulota bacterium]